MIDALEALALDGTATGLLDRGGRQLRWFSAGSGPATVVLEPGAGDSASIWLPIVARLTAVARVVMYDRAGFGDSGKPARLDLGVTLADLRAIVGEVSGVSCVLIGHSWGGLLVQLLALADPGLISALVLVDPAHERFWLDMPASDLAMMARAHLDLDVSAHIAEHAESSRWVAESTTDDPALRELVRRAHLAYAATERQVRNAAAELPLIAASLDDLVRRRAAAPPISAPTVLLTAMKGRPEQYRQPVLDVQEGLVAAMPSAAHEVVWDSGHYIHVEQPQRVVAATKDVVAQAASSCS